MKLQDIKLIVSDLDGTLFNSDQENYEISKELLYWIGQLKKQGVEFTIATGRPEYSSLWVARKMELSLPYIAYNGGMILDKDGRVFYETDYQLKNWKFFIREIDKLNGTILLYSGEGVQYYRKTKAINIYEKKEKITCIPFDKEKMDMAKVKKILLIGDNKKHLGAWEKYLSSDLKKSHRYLISEHNYMEIVEKDVSKGHALHILQQELGITNKQIMGFGNQINDKELLEEAYIGVAVANADWELKKLADMVTEGEYEAGVIETMKTLYQQLIRRSQ